jgi:hypothetical protein
MAADSRLMVVITTGKMEVAIVIAAMAAQHRRLKEHLADRCIFRIVHQHVLRALLLFGQAKPDMAGISIGKATGSVANNSVTKILNGMTEILDDPHSPEMSGRVR